MCAILYIFWNDAILLMIPSSLGVLLILDVL